ncbi:MAG: hypothetical protein AAF934_11905 [Bacteroidota bacterium]
MKPIERLHQYINYKGVSMNAFDATIGVGNGYIGKQIKKKGSVGSDILEKIFACYPELNPTWLLTGKGAMLLEAQNDTAQTSEPEQQQDMFNTFSTAERAEFEKVLDTLSVDKIITYIYEHEARRGFDRNATYQLFLKIKAQKAIIEKLEAIEARYMKELSKLKAEYIR